MIGGGDLKLLVAAAVLIPFAGLHLRDLGGFAGGCPGSGDACPVHWNPSGLRISNSRPRAASGAIWRQHRRGGSALEPSANPPLQCEPDKIERAPSTARDPIVGRRADSRPTIRRRTDRRRPAPAAARPHTRRGPRSRDSTRSRDSCSTRGRRGPSPERGQAEVRPTTVPVSVAMTVMAISVTVAAVAAAPACRSGRRSSPRGHPTIRDRPGHRPSLRACRRGRHRLRRDAGPPPARRSPEGKCLQALRAPSSSSSLQLRGVVRVRR